MRCGASVRAVSIRIGTAEVRRSACGEFEPALARHHHVDDEEVEGEQRQLPARLRRRCRGGDAKAVRAEEALQQRADAHVVVDDEEVGRVVARAFAPFGAGSRLTTRRPRRTSRAAFGRSAASTMP